MSVIDFPCTPEPRLRFDKVATGLVKRLQGALSNSVPEDKVVVVTITAPIRQDSRTREALLSNITRLLDTGRARWRSLIEGNRVDVRVLDGNVRGPQRFIGFVHNPKPDPEILFDVTKSVLALMAVANPSAERWLIVANEDGSRPVETIRQVCLALNAKTVFKRILSAEARGVKVL